MKNGDKIAGAITQVEVEINSSLVTVSAEGINKLILSDSYEEEGDGDVLISDSQCGGNQ